MRLVHPIVRAAMDSDGSFTPLCFGRVFLARSFECASDLDADVANYRRARLSRVVVEKNLWPSLRKPGWVRMNAQNFSSAVLPVEPTAPGAASRLTARSSC